MIAIRLKPTGTKSRKQWRVVVIDSRLPRNGRLIEEIGFYNPLVNPPDVQIKMDRYDAWLSKGAQPSKTLKTVIARRPKADDTSSSAAEPRAI